MRTREEALSYGLSFPDTYQDAPFHDENWQLGLIFAAMMAVMLASAELQVWIDIATEKLKAV